MVITLNELILISGFAHDFYQHYSASLYIGGAIFIVSSLVILPAYVSTRNKWVYQVWMKSYLTLLFLASLKHWNFVLKYYSWFIMLCLWRFYGSTCWLSEVGYDYVIFMSNTCKLFVTSSDIWPYLDMETMTQQYKLTWTRVPEQRRKKREDENDILNK